MVRMGKTRHVTYSFIRINIMCFQQAMSVLPMASMKHNFESLSVTSLLELGEEFWQLVSMVA